MVGLVVDSVNPHILFSSNSDNLLKSTDNGTHWQQLGGDLSIRASSFFPLNPDVTQSLRVLTFTNNKYSGEYIMAISHVGGEQWRKTDARVDLSNEGSISITIEASDPKNPKILYGVYNKTAWGDPISTTLYKSIDEGLSWINVPERHHMTNFVISPHNSEKLYANFRVMMVSNNGGKNWDNLGNLRENRVDYRITRVHIDPTDPHILYANLKDYNGVYWGASQSLAKSYNSGQSWQVIDTSIYLPGEIVINAQNNQKLLMAYGGGVLRSENGGIDWARRNASLLNINTIQLNKTNAGQKRLFQV